MDTIREFCFLFERCYRRRCIRYPSKIEGIRERVRGKKFQEHYDQAQLFFNSLAPHEKKHLIDAFSFELDHCDDPVVYETYTKLLNCIDFELAKKVASNVGGVIPEQDFKPLRKPALRDAFRAALAQS